MKKYMIGFILGVAVTAAGSAYADEIQSIVGKTIEGQFPVKIAGKQLDTQAAVVDGTSYLPVRAIGDALNMDVKFDSDLGIELTQKGVTPVAETTTPQPEATPVPTTTSDVEGKSVQEQISNIKKQLEDEKRNLEDQKGLLKINEGFLTDPKINKEEAQKFVDMYKNIIADIETRIADYEKQIADLEAQQ